MLTDSNSQFLCEHGIWYREALLEDIPWECFTYKTTCFVDDNTITETLTRIAVIGVVNRSRGNFLELLNIWNERAQRFPAQHIRYQYTAV